MGALRLLQSFYCFKVVVMIRHSDAFIMRHMYIQVSKREVISSCALSNQTWSSLWAFIWDSCCFSERKFRFGDMFQAWGGNP